MLPYRPAMFTPSRPLIVQWRCACRRHAEARSLSCAAVVSAGCVVMSAYWSRCSRCVAVEFGVAVGVESGLASIEMGGTVLVRCLRISRSGSSKIVTSRSQGTYRVNIPRSRSMGTSSALGATCLESPPRRTSQEADCVPLSIASRWRSPAMDTTPGYCWC